MKAKIDNKLISENAFFPRVNTGLISGLLVLIDKNWEKILKGYNDEKRKEVGMTLHRLKEAIIKLDYRYFELISIVKTFDQLTNEEQGEPLHYLQIAFVDKVEAFHQQVYATISTTMLVINHIGYKGKRINHPIDSVKKFLEYIKGEIFKYRSVLGDQIDILEKSRDFRAKFIDHPQQHQLHDWMTFRAEDGLYLIFFMRKGDEVYAIDPTIHPFDPNFKPPVNCGEDYYIAPSEGKTLKAVEIFIKHILDF